MKNVMIALGCGTVAGVAALVTLYAVGWVGQLGAQVILMSWVFICTLLVTGLLGAALALLTRRVFRGLDARSVRALEERIARLEAQSGPSA